MLNRLEKQIRHLQVFSNKVAEELLAGEYHSVFKGHGLEFSELREYQYGDEPRRINWQITAKTGKPFVKRYIEERELTLFFIVDLSASGSFGSSERTKTETATELCALLSFSAIKNSDKVGLIIFTDKIEKIIPPGRGKRHVLRIINELLTFKPQGAATDINKALDYFGHLHAKRSVAFIISDFQDSGFEKTAAVIARQHDLIAVSISDPAEYSLPNVGMVSLCDPETGETALIDTSSKKVRDKFNHDALKRKAELHDMLTRHNIDEIAISTDKDIVAELIYFFKTREKRGHHG
jgi:uncharacterized protein (DUF58 family)